MLDKMFVRIWTVLTKSTKLKSPYRLLRAWLCVNGYQYFLKLKSGICIFIFVIYITCAYGGFSQIAPFNAYTAISWIRALCTVAWQVQYIMQCSLDTCKDNCGKLRLYSYEELTFKFNFGIIKLIRQLNPLLKRWWLIKLNQVQ